MITAWVVTIGWVVAVTCGVFMVALVVVDVGWLLRPDQHPGDNQPSVEPDGGLVAGPGAGAPTPEPCRGRVARAVAAVLVLAATPLVAATATPVTWWAVCALLVVHIRAVLLAAAWRAFPARPTDVEVLTRRGAAAIGVLVAVAVAPLAVIGATSIELATPRPAAAALVALAGVGVLAHALGPLLAEPTTPVPDVAVSHLGGAVTPHR